jgi:chromate transporter
VETEKRTTLRELAGLFLTLGSIGFGGPAVHIAMLRTAVVVKRGWLSEERFLDLLGAANLIPGPTSTEMAIHVGYDRRGFPGLLVAGVSFIVPAMLICGALGWAYTRWGRLPETRWLLLVIRPIALILVAHAIWKLAPRAARSWPLRVLGVLAVVAAALGANELVVLLSGGLAGIALARVRPAAALLVPVVPVVAAAAPISLPAIFGIFAKVGAVLFGSGYVLIAFLRGELVERLGWLTEPQLLDAVAVGQITPGPVFTTATFVGWLLAGPSGALVATAGIFLPAFVFVAITAPMVRRLRESRTAGAFLDGVNVASVALMAVVTVQLGHAALVDAGILR